MEQKGQRTVQTPPHGTVRRTLPISPVDQQAQKKLATQKTVSKNLPVKKKKVVDIAGYKKRKHRAGNTRWVRLLLLFVVCGISGYFFSLSGFFAVDKIMVQGNSLVSADAVIRSSGIKQGDNIFAVSGKKAAQWTQINYMISNAEIIKDYPNTVIISIKERIPALLIPVKNGFLLTDINGVVVSRLKSVDKPELPILTGIKGVADGTVLGTKLQTDNLAAGLSIISQMNDCAKSFITEIDVNNVQKIVLCTKDNTVVRIGSSSNFADKFEALYAILQAQEKEGLLHSISYMDISLPERPAIFYSK